MSKQKRKLKKNQVQVDSKIYDVNSPSYAQMYEDKFEGGDVVWDNLLEEWVSVPKGMNDAWDELYKNQRVGKAQDKVRKGTGDFAKGVAQGAGTMLGYTGEAMNTPLALLGEYLSGRNDYYSALPNMSRVMTDMGLESQLRPEDQYWLPNNDQLTPGALVSDNPLIQMGVDIPLDILTGKGFKTLTKSPKTLKNIQKALTKNQLPEQFQNASQAGFSSSFSKIPDEITNEGNLTIKKTFGKNTSVPENINIEGKSGSWQLKKNNAGENVWYFSANMTNPVESGRTAMKMNELFPLANPSILEPNSLSLDSYDLLLNMGKRPHWSMNFENYIPLNYSHKHSDLIKDLGLSAKDETYRLMSQETADEIANRINDMLLKKGIEQKARTFQIGDYRGIEVPNFKLTRDYQTGGMIKRKDGSYSQRGLWDNIRANKGSGKKPTKEMLEQEKKIKKKMAVGGEVKPNPVDPPNYKDRLQQYLSLSPEYRNMFTARSPLEYGLSTNGLDAGMYFDPMSNMPGMYGALNLNKKGFNLGAEKRIGLGENTTDLNAGFSNDKFNVSGNLKRGIQGNEFGFSAGYNTPNLNIGASYSNVGGMPNVNANVGFNKNNFRGGLGYEYSDGNRLTGNVGYSNDVFDVGLTGMYSPTDSNITANLNYKLGTKKKQKTEPITIKKNEELKEIKLINDDEVLSGEAAFPTNMKKKKTKNLPLDNNLPKASLGAILGGLPTGAAGGLSGAGGAGGGIGSLSNMNNMSLSTAGGPLGKVMKMLNGPLAPLMGMTMNAVTDMTNAIVNPERERRPVLQNAASYTFENGGTVGDALQTTGTMKDIYEDNISPMFFQNKTKPLTPMAGSGDEYAYGGMIDPSMYMQQMMYGSYAQGGQVPNIPVEVEGQEMYEMPNGQTGEFQGPSHENGGIPVALPEGTKVYSDRLKVNGKTMADRKDKRENNIKKLEKLLTKNPNDKFIKESLKRQQETASLEEQSDMAMQEQANQQQAQQEQAMMQEQAMAGLMQDPAMMQQMGMMMYGGKLGNGTPPYGLLNYISPTLASNVRKMQAAAEEPCNPGFVKDTNGNCVPAPREVSGVEINKAFRKGGTGQIEPPGVNPYDVMSDIMGNTFGNISRSKDPYINTKGGLIPNPLYNEVIGNKMLPEEDPKKPNRFMNFLNNAVDQTGDFLSGMFDKNGKPKKEKSTKTNQEDIYNLTEGDRVGMAGTRLGMYGPAAMTMLNRLETPPNINFFSTFGQDALRTQEEAEGLAGISKDEAYRKNLMRANALRKQLTNTARGVNDIRSGQLSAALTEQEGARGILANYLQGMSGLKGQRAQLQQQIDQTRMGGEYQRDLADRQDIDQYYTNLAENVANASNMVQKQGRDLNVVQYNKDIMALSKAYSKYGVYAVRDPRTGLLNLAQKDANGKIVYLTEDEVKELPNTTKVEK